MISSYSIHDQQSVKLKTSFGCVPQMICVIFLFVDSFLYNVIIKYPTTP